MPPPSLRRSATRPDSLDGAEPLDETDQLRPKIGILGDIAEHGVLRASRGDGLVVCPGARRSAVNEQTTTIRRVTLARDEAIALEPVERAGHGLRLDVAARGDANGRERSAGEHVQHDHPSVGQPARGQALCPCALGETAGSGEQATRCPSVDIARHPPMITECSAG